MKLLYFLLPFAMLSCVAFAQSPETNIEQAIATGNAEQLLPYFGTTVDLRILDVENVYGNSQAQVLLNNFFVSNPPTSFVVAHRKVRTDNSFFIGTYTSQTGTFRVSIFLKTENNQSRISQILIQNSAALEGGKF